MDQLNLGVVDDSRTSAQKEYDYLHSEIFTSSIPSYLGSRTTASRFVGEFPLDDQLQTSSCVAHGKVLCTSIFCYISGVTGTFTHLSSMFIYRKRVNYPDLGMIPNDANMLTIKKGAPIYADMPTPKTEIEANLLATDPAMEKSAQQFAAGKWVQLVDPKDIDTMAFVSNSLSLPLNILIYATYAEWSKDTVHVLTPGLAQSSDEAKVRHCVTILPKSAFIDPADGMRYVIIQDSALFGGFAFRAVGEDFIKERVYECDYLIAMGNAPIVSKPRYQFNTDMMVGDTGPNVLALQQCLQYLGYLPNVVNGASFAPTSYYGGMTKHAVQKMQSEYKFAPIATGYCGPKTRAFLNTLFAVSKPVVQ